MYFACVDSEAVAESDDSDTGSLMSSESDTRVDVEHEPIETERGGSRDTRGLTPKEWIRKRLIGENGDKLAQWMPCMRNEVCFSYGINPAEMLNARFKSLMRYVDMRRSV
jgi:hypothetical protein